MPWRPKSHRPKSNRRHARTTTERGYGWKHQQFRARMIRERPLCEDCLKEGIVTPATDLHHIAKVKDRPDLAMDPRNALMICEQCHDKRTARGE